MKDIDKYQVWTAIITPMNDDGSVDYESFEKLLREQDAVGNAVTILGSTGEALNIDHSEREQIIKFACGLNLNIPLMAGVGGTNLKAQLAWIDYLNKMDIDAYLLVVPLYAKPGIHGQYEWFKALLDSAKKPCMLYNVPGRTAKKLEIETVKMLSGQPNFWAIKEASGSEEEFSKYREAAPKAKMMSGDDLMLPKFAKLGAEGVVSVASNVWPNAVKIYADQCLRKSFSSEELWENAIEALFAASNPIPAKAILYKLGKIKSPELRLPLSSKDMQGLDSLLSLNDKILQWEKANS
ncbi:MAG TPA: 4-hydroxy-tetrahydrodipicolinate synthase [Candidatus Saccharimonadales bacterium]|nr:4-hydroxy-tetrahydrodipicolinate synthase [Candidatus Saccharimonadales bacterium]